MDAAIEPKVQKRGVFRFRNLLSALGPGLITGAADDDPSGIGTYSQAGAQLGFGVGWTMLLSYPLMTAIQDISARIGRVTGHGIAGNVCRNFGPVYIWSLVLLLFVANTINIAADLGAMADALKLLIGGPAIAYVVLFGAVSVLAQIFFNYDGYVAVLKWLTLSLFAYVIALATVKVPWAEALNGILIPHVSWNVAFLTTLVAILGTTISPYLFIWQSAQEADEQRIDANKRPLKQSASDAPKEFRRIRLDTLIGMAFSNLIALPHDRRDPSRARQNRHPEFRSSRRGAEADRRPTCRTRLCSRDHRHRTSRHSRARRLDRVRRRRGATLEGWPVPEAQGGDSFLCGAGSLRPLRYRLELHADRSDQGTLLERSG
jgi:hypothetical protein